MFRFKQFGVEQDRTPMKVGTDGVLLGAWVAINGQERTILDIGTGTALIALMMAQRSCAVVDAVEIDEPSCVQARENVESSPWSDRVAVYSSAIQEFNSGVKYDLIVSNPPFFCDSLLSPNAARTVARHTTSLSFRELVDSVVGLLLEHGRFALILPTVEMQRFHEECVGRLYLSRRSRVHSVIGGEVKRVICEYRLSPTEHIQEQTLTIMIGKGREDYSEEYKALTSDFYLKF